MYFTLRNIQKGDEVKLQQYIDNLWGKKSIGSQSVTDKVEWFNNDTDQRFSWGRGGGGDVMSVDIRHGLHKFDKLQTIITNETFGN